MVRFVFSALYNESAEYLDFFVDNFLAHTDHLCHLYVNLSLQSPASEQQIDSARVTVFRGGFERQAFGPTLLAGHFEAFVRACSEIADFEYFSTIASNSLFFRQFDSPAVLQELSLRPRHTPTQAIHDLPNKWYWPHLRSESSACEALAHKWNLQALTDGQIEGRFASRDDWQIVRDVHESLMPHWQSLQAPLEEILPPTVICVLGSGKTINICYNRFAEIKEAYRGGFATAQDLSAPHYPQHICLLKWFERSSLNPETMQVATEYGRELTRWLTQEPPDSRIRLEQELLLGHNYHALLQCRTYNSLVGDADATETAPVVTSFQLEAKRQVVDPQGLITNRSGAFFFLEDTGLALTIKTKTTDQNELFLHCYFNGSPVELTSQQNILKQAYFYLPIPSRSALRLLLQGSVHGVQPSAIIQHLCLFDGRGFGLRPPVAPTIIFHEFTCELYLDTSAAQMAHLGIPLYLGMSLRLRLHDIGA